jgi:biopolymer transport protein ExbD
MPATTADDEAITAINVTPLVDVCLVLVIIFMAVAPFALTLGIKVLESRGGAAVGKSAMEDNVQVHLNAAGRLTINGGEVSPGALALELSKALARSREKMVIVSADEQNRVGEVVTILDTARQAGARKLAILRSEEASAGGGRDEGLWPLRASRKTRLSRGST